MSSVTVDASPKETVPENFWAPLKKLWLLFWAPESLFLSLRHRPDWLTPFLLVCLATVILSYSLAPYALRAALSSLPEGTPSEQAELFQQQVAFGQRLGLFFVPLLILFKCLIAALVLALLMIVFTGNGSFKQSFCLFNYLNIILTLLTACSLLVLKLRGLEQIKGPFDLQVGLGLNLFFSTENVVVKTLLHAFNPFDLWYLILLIIAIRCLLDCSRLMASSIGLVYWALAMALQVALAMIEKGLAVRT